MEYLVAPSFDRQRGRSNAETDANRNGMGKNATVLELLFIDIRNVMRSKLLILLFISPESNQPEPFRPQRQRKSVS